VRIVSFPEEVPLGSPIYLTIEIQNVSGKALTLSYIHSGLSTLEIKDEEGKSVENPRKMYMLSSGDSRKVVVPAGWIERTTFGPIFYLGKAGKYFIKATISRKGPYYFLENGRKMSFKAWEGNVSSDTIAIVVKNPEGIDLEAYNYFKGEPLSKPDQLFQRFPTSTYAGYVVYGSLKGFASADFANPMFLRSLETGLFLSNSYPTENGRMEMKDEMNAAWWSKWAGIILKNHPDIWFADELRLKLAMNHVALKNYQTAEADFIKLSKEAKPYIAEKAGLFVEIMKQKGWVSAPVEKSVPEAVVVK